MPRTRRPARTPKPKPKPTPTPAPYKNLADYLARSGDTQQEIARRVGTTQAYISVLARGGANPRLMLAVRIADYCKIPLDSFMKTRLARKLDEDNNGTAA